VVFSARPARVKQIVEINLPARRNLEMKLLPRFRELQDEIWRTIYEETMHLVAAQ
jgi:ABC-type nitrate/sulfonate/bicarbonate transport system ATPase subunit